MAQSERDKLVQAIGEHVVANVERWTKAPVGARLVVPAKVPRPRSSEELKYIFPQLSDWTLRVTVEAPSLQLYLGPGDYKTLDLEEALAVLDKYGFGR